MPPSPLREAAGVAARRSRSSMSIPTRRSSTPRHRKRCDLIVMASHGRHGVSAIVLGSETVKVLTHCKIPVLVYR